MEPSDVCGHPNLSFLNPCRISLNQAVECTKLSTHFIPSRSSTTTSSLSSNSTCKTTWSRGRRGRRGRTKRRQPSGAGRSTIKPTTRIARRRSRRIKAGEGDESVTLLAVVVWLSWVHASVTVVGETIISIHALEAGAVAAAHSRAAVVVAAAAAAAAVAVEDVLQLRPVGVRLIGIAGVGGTIRIKRSSGSGGSGLVVAASVLAALIWIG